jgi:histidinol-phosphate aminotransferase
MSAQSTHPLARPVLEGLNLPDPEQREEICRTRKVVDLASNTNPWGSELACYPPSRPVAIHERYATFLRDELRAAGAPALAPRAEQVLFTSGSVEGISLLVAAFCEPFKDCICVCDPTFPFYARAATCNDVAVRHESLQGRDLSSFDPRAVSMHRPKLTFLCSPSNPVGSTLDPACITELLDATCGLVVIDEAYLEFSMRPSALRWLTTAPNLVVLRTFSKAWGLAGARVGAVISDPMILYTLRLVQLSYAFGTPGQRHVQEALEEPAKMKQDVQRIRAQRDRFAQDLQRLAIVKRVYPSDTNFLLVAFNDALSAHKALLNAGILVADTCRQVPDTLRISTSTAEHCDQVIDVLRGMR